MTAGRKGLTLIEVLLTLAIFSIVIVIAASVLVDTLKVKNAVERKKGMTGISTGVLRMISDELKSAYFFKGLSRGLAIEDDEVDGLPADTLSFVCSAYSKLRPRNKGALLSVSYYCEEDEESGALNLIRSERVISAPEGNERNREIISRGIRAFNVRYFDGEEWQDGAVVEESGTHRGASAARTKESPLPEAVEVTVNFDERFLVVIPEDAMLTADTLADEESIFDDEGQVKGFRIVVKLPAAIL